MIPAKSTGFTAVILTYDRLDSLYKIIQQVALAPSLAKVLVIWNNQLKAPPPGNIPYSVILILAPSNILHSVILKGNATLKNIWLKMNICV